MKSLSIRVLVVAMLALGVASSAWAQTDEEHFATFPFNFSNPGARAAGMGGAFIGTPNDASSAVSNPAGLTNLLQKQIYIEGRGINQPFAHLQLPDSLLSGFGTIANKTTGGITFFNVAIPWEKHKLSFGFSYNQFLQYTDKLSYSERRVITYSQPLLPKLAMNSEFSYTGRTMAGTVGYKLAENFRVGGSLSVNRVSGFLEATRTVPSALAQQIYFPNSKMDASGWALGYNLGALYEPVTDTLFLGLTYNDVRSVTLSETLTGANPSSPRPATRDVVFDVPRRIGFGASWKTMDKRVVLAFDATHIYYNDLAKQTTVVLFDDAIPVSGAASNLTKVVGYNQTSPTGSNSAYTSSQFSIKDGTEYRGGAEFKVVTGAKPLFIRFGLFRTPVHNLEYNVGGTRRDPPCSANGTNCTGREYADQVIRQVFDITKSAVLGTPVAGKNELDLNQPTFPLGYPDVGWSVGGGWIVGNYQFDVAYTSSSYQRSEFVASAAIRFGK